MRLSVPGVSEVSKWGEFASQVPNGPYPRAWWRSRCATSGHALVKLVNLVKAWGGRTPRRVAAAMVKPSVKLVKVKMVKAGRRRPGAAS